MAYRLPHHVGKQDWIQPENEDRERGRHSWVNGMVPEQVERLPQMTAGQVPPGVYHPPMDCNYHASTNGVAHNYGSTPTPLNIENIPVISNPCIHANASSPIMPRWFQEPSVLPVAQYFPQGNRSSEVLEPIYQQPRVHHATGYMSSVPVRETAPVVQDQFAQAVPNIGAGAPYQQARSEPSMASQPLFSRNLSKLETDSSSYGTPPDMMQYSVTCPYECGTILSGIHAVGNLTRHLKSRACPNSPRRAVEYPCPIYGCINKYARSDGLKVHMRRRHGAPAAEPKAGSPTEGSVGEE